MNPAPRLDAHTLQVPRVAWPTLALVVLALALCLVGAYAAARGQRGLGATCVFLAGWMSFTALHEAAHGTVGRGRWINALAGEIAASVLLCRYLAFRQIHHRHHRFTNDPERDPDRFTGAGPSWQRPLRLALSDLRYYLEFEPRALRSSLVEGRLSQLSAALLGVTLIALIALGHGWTLVCVWIIPIRLAMFSAALVADYLPHMRPSAPSRSESPLAHTAQLAPSLLVDALTLCHSHHLLHHLWPRVPFYRLPRVWRARRDELRAIGAIVRWG